MGNHSDFELLGSDIRRQPDLLVNLAAGLRAEAESVAATFPSKPTRIYLVGCGDSLNVGMAVRNAWESALGVPVDAVPALTFSRFAVNTAPPSALVVALSQSGTVVRVVEAVRQARRMGLATVSVTATEGSPLAVEPSTARFLTGFTKLGQVPGTTSYALNIAVFYELAAAFAAEWDVGSGASAHLRGQVDRLPQHISDSLDAVWAVAREHARAVQKGAPLLALGTGPNLANAHFLGRKMFEVTQTTTLSQETEEYAHDEISIVDRHWSVVQFVPPDAALSRSIEILDSTLALGCSTAIVTEAGALDAVDSRVRFVYELAPGLDSLCNVPLYALPASIFTYELALLQGGSYYAMDDAVHAALGDRLIYGSQFVA